MTSTVSSPRAPKPPPLPTMHTPTSTGATAAATSASPKEANTFPTTPPAHGTCDAAKLVNSLPTPTSASDGRCQAAQLLKERIKTMQEEDIAPGSGRGGSLFPPSPASMTVDDTTRADVSRIADFSAGDGESSSCNSHNEQQLRHEKNEAQATMALLQAELLAARGRHEEEKREWIRSMDELRRRNEELEGRLSLYCLEGGGSDKAKRIVNLRSASCPKSIQEEMGENDSQTTGAFGSRMRSLAQRWGTPPVRGAPPPQKLLPVTKDGMARSVLSPLHSSQISCLTVATSEIETAGLNLQGDISLQGSDQQRFIEVLQETIASLEEKLRQSEHRAKVLEQRLQIVKESGDAVIRSLNEELSDVVEDRARSESAMIKELAALDSQRRQEKEEYERRIKDWIALDKNRQVEVKEYERRIMSLLDTVKMMDARSNGEQDFFDSAVATASSNSFDVEAEQEMLKDLIEYLELLSQRRTVVRAVNEALDMEFNANPNVADEMIDYYRSRPELKEFTLKSELPRMDYEVLVVDDETGKDVKLVSTDDIRSYFSSLEEKNQLIDEEVEIILRAANQSLLADPLAMLTGEGDGKLVHSGSFHSTLIATVCSFQLDLRREGERRVKINCELAICVPSGTDGVGRAPARSSDDSDTKENEEEKAEQSATLELARADLAIQFSPSPTSTPSGPLVKYTLLDVKPTITDYEEGSDDSKAIRMAAAVLARDRYNNIRVSGTQLSSEEKRPTATRRFLSRFSTMSIRYGDQDQVGE
eukprot:CCRYP_004903-RA/>CCRYP_004903-RA protein AED:0.16 eAED:0.16 QI:0/-1/0/1/-1/1/1/0/761